MDNVVPMPHKPTALDALLGMSFHTDDMAVLRPGLDYRDGHLYMTIPFDRDETKTVGRGPAAKEVTTRVTTTVCIRSGGPSDPNPAAFPFDEDGVRERGFRFPETFTQANSNRWPMDSLTAYLDHKAAFVDPSDLFDEIREVYRTHVEYPDPIYYDVVPLFVMGSYLFRVFAATGYIHFNGTRDSGKSQNMNVLSALGFNTVWASNMTPASLFRTIAGCPGVICVDEAESEHWKTEKGQELRQILLAGYSDGSTVTRTEKGPNDRFITVSYEAYSPKILASIAPLDPTLQSRCLVIPMQRAIRTIPEFNADDPRWIALRGRLYTWAMQHHAEVRRLRDQWTANRTEWAPELKTRSWQIAQIYLVIAEHVGERELADRVVAFFTEYFAKAAKSREDSDQQLTLLKALPRVLASTAPHPGLFYGIKDIHGVVSSYLEEDAKEYYKTRAVARHLVTLGFPKSQAAKGGKQIQIPEDVVRTAFNRHHVTPFDEDIAWLAGETSYQDGVRMPTEPVQQAPEEPLGWLDELLEQEAS